MSEQAGYSVLRGMKELGVSVPANYFEEEAKEDVEMAEQNDQEEQKEENQPIIGYFAALL